MYHNFIGIDVSKNEFHVAIHGNSNVKRFANTAIGFKAFKKANQPILADALVVLEATGGYEAALLKYLQDVKIAAHRANTRIVKSFIRSLAKLGKSDAIDAHGLARYAKEKHEELAIHVQISNAEK